MVPVNYELALGLNSFPYSDDEQDVVVLSLLGDAPTGVLDGLVQEGGEIGGAIELHLTQCVAVCIYDTLRR